MQSDTELSAKEATDAKTLANSTSPRPESNGRRRGQGFGQKSRRKTSLHFSLLARVILGIIVPVGWKGQGLIQGGSVETWDFQGNPKFPKRTDNNKTKKRSLSLRLSVPRSIDHHMERPS